MADKPSGPLVRIEALLDELRVQIDKLHAMVGRLEDVKEWEASILTEENDVGDLLTRAELTEDLTSMRSARADGDEIRSQVHGTFDTLIQGLFAALSEALREAGTSHKSLEQMVNEATSMLVQRKTALDVSAKRAEEALERREREEAAALAHEETSAFDGRFLSGTERRKHPREPIAVEVTLDEGGSAVPGSSENLSVGGLFISTDAEFELGTLLHVSCTLPDGRVVRADGLVSWMRSQETEVEPGIGVEFLALSDDDRQLLERLDHLE